MTDNHEIVLRSNNSRSPTPHRSVTPKNDLSKNKNENKLNTYLYFAVKIIFLIFIIYLFIVVFRSISNDVSMEVLRQNDLDLQKIKQCEEEYKLNKCAEKKYIALKEKCEYLEACMNAPRQGVAKSKVAAKYFATLLNELINPLSPKTVILFALVIIFVVWLPKLF